MNPQELIEHLAASAGVSSSQAEAVLGALVKAVHEAARAGNELTITDLGQFGIFQQAGMVGKNPQTGEAIEIPAKRVVKFTPARALKDAAAQ